jgi:hypothetical protein
MEWQENWLLRLSASFQIDSLRAGRLQGVFTPFWGWFFTGFSSLRPGP